ncbi:protein Skeletor, isoforms B/C-like [Tigriopus californicus]|nr:protein Skeletor, isoforms B/C-like [Tigriopus californicus]|eukprot:TCALIF_03572-PA protein Name:"Similar to Skeletor Protein Skeletor, isoforms B/C (Drosophila melanogaster)" AED:0.01 eAED:0.01 QI:134/1/0.66/1/0.5/0.33/3/0/264
MLLPLVILQLTLSSYILSVVKGEVPSDWEYYGKFRFVQHLVQGELYGKDSRSLFIHRFYYDGEGPPGVTFTAIPKDETDYAQGIPLAIVELDNQEQVPKTLNNNYTLALPRNLRVSDVDRLVVWCSEYGVSFGRVDLREARNTSPKRPKTDLTLVGSFTNVEHRVAGTVYIQDREHLVIRDFNYDGQGPSVVLYAGEEENLKTGRFLEYPYAGYKSRLGPKRLTRVQKRDITIRLPKDMDAFKLRWLSVWCDTFEVSFGHVEFE